MPGRKDKDKKGDRKRAREKGGDGGAGSLAAMFGLGGAGIVDCSSC